MTDDRLVLHGSFTSSSSYKPMLFLALAGTPASAAQAPATSAWRLVSWGNWG